MRSISAPLFLTAKCYFDPHSSRYILRKELTTFGSKVADIKLMSLAVVKEHCSVRFDGTSIFIIGEWG